MDNESTILKRTPSFYDLLPPVGDPMRPDWSCLYTKGTVLAVMHEHGKNPSPELPKKGQPPVVIEFSPAPWVTHRYAEIAWEPYTSDIGERLYSYKLWKTKPLALPSRVSADGKPQPGWQRGS